MRHGRRLLLPALLALGAVACAQTFQAGAAVVNGVPISTTELERQIDTQVGAEVGQPALTGEARLRRARDLLVQLIQTELIRQEIRARDIQVDQAAVEAQLEALRQGQPEEEFLQRVEQAGFTLETLREQIGLREAVGEIQRQLSPEIDDEQVREIYEVSREQFRQARIRHILFSVDPEGGNEARAQRRARATLVEIQAGASFAALARERSEDPGSAQDGGLLPGWTTLADLDPSFAQGVRDATIGEVTEPVRSRFGWHLILVLDRRVQPFAQVRDQLRAQLEQQGADAALQEYLGELLGSADISINPRYGDWDPETGSIVPHTFFTRPEPDTDPLAPPMDPFAPPGG